MVSTIHSREEIIMQRRRRPRDNQYNKQFLLLVFGERAVTDVGIPRVIYYYNHIMKGVDLSDQLNASYRPKVRVRRYWFVMKEHGAAVPRVNSYVICQYATRKADSHGNKKLMTEWVEAFMGHAAAL